MSPKQPKGVRHLVQRCNNETIAKLVSEIAVAFLAQNPVGLDDVEKLLRAIRRGLCATGSEISQEVPSIETITFASDAAPNGLSSEALKPAVPVGDSITDDFIISLEDGRPFRSLRRHLMAKYGMTPDDYRAKWGLESTYPMVAPNYSRDRSEVAKRVGLGRPTKGRKAKI